MKYNKLGNTGLLVSEFCLGTLTFGDHKDFRLLGGLGQLEADGLVKLAIDAGINMIDTANMYSAGLAEEITGNSIRNLGISRDSLVLATKVRSAMGEGPNDKGLSRKHILAQAEASLKRLKTDYIDLYQIHSYDPLTPIDETLRALEDLVRSGMVRYIGASNLASWQLMKALAYSDKKDITPFCSMQSYYSLASRDIEREMIPLLEDQHIGLMVWSPLAGGMLTGKYKRDGKTGGGRRDAANFPTVDMERTFRVLDVLEPMAEKKQVSVAQLAIAWLLQRPVVSTVILGVRNEEQFRDNLGAASFSFTSEELTELNEASKLPPEYPGWLFEFAHLDRQLS
jgi:aryl-alcohol dehydrogenase-like predicted oxidoreductase